MLVLVGYRGTGKTTTAAAVAAELGWPWRDADHVLAERLGEPIGPYFVRAGEPAFRDREAEILAELLAGEPIVLATGGGVVVRPENRARLKPVPVVWLQAAPATLAARLAADANTLASRPGLTTAGPLAEIEAVLAKRLPWYAEVADFAVETDRRTPDEVAADIVTWFRGRPGTG